MSTSILRGRVIIASVVTALGTGLLLPSNLSVSAAALPQGQQEQVCEGTHLPGNNQTSITVTAPEGMLISGYCVKAGSIQQGDGPENVSLNPPVASVTITHSSGKEISHYVVHFVQAPTTTTTVATTPPTDPATTTTISDYPPQPPPTTLPSQPTQPTTPTQPTAPPALPATGSPTTLTPISVAALVMMLGGLVVVTLVRRRTSLR